MKNKIIICPRSIICGNVINYDVEFYGTHDIPTRRVYREWGRGGRGSYEWTDFREVYNKKPYFVTVIAKESLEGFLQRHEKDYSIEIWE